MIILSVIAVIAAAGAIYVGIQKSKNERDKVKNKPKQEQTESSSAHYNPGKENMSIMEISRILTLLFLGVDKDEEVTVKETTGRSGQSDCIILLVLDTEEKKTTLSILSRDTMADVKRYGLEGDYLSTETAQTSTSYAYGDGEMRRLQVKQGSYYDSFV